MRRRGNVKYIEEEVPTNEDWYTVGFVVAVLCELMMSLYFVNISWSTYLGAGSAATWPILFN